MDDGLVEPTRHKLDVDDFYRMADAGIFDEKLMRQCISDSIAAWGLSDRPELADFVR